MQFFHVCSAADARTQFARAVPLLNTETLPLVQAVDRVLAVEALAPQDLPEFSRAVVDGFAVRAADTFGAGAGQPAYLRLVGEVRMGEAARVPVGPGETVRIATGGMVPEGADAVVMVEYTDSAGSDLVEVQRAAAPREGMVLVGDDLRAGATLLPRGRRLRPQDLGALAAVGIVTVAVFRRPRVAVVPSGDEVVPPEATPAPGQVRDVNSVALAAAVLRAGGEPRPFPIVPDDPEALRAAVTAALDCSDLVLIAGGSSVGARDWTLDVLRALPGAELLLHGVAIRPGKPVILVAAGDRLLVGLPGNPVSALVVFDRFVRPYLRRLAGENAAAFGRGTLRARLSRSYASDAGKEDYVRVRLRASGGELVAEPLLGKSTLLATLVEADGLVTVADQVEGLETGEIVEVEPF